jgi:hypothetical protein
MENLMTFVGQVLVLAAIFGVAIAFIRLPRWYGVSISRHKMWRLHDQIINDIITGALPEVEAVWMLVDDVDSTIEIARFVTLPRLLAMRRRRRGESSRSVEREQTREQSLALLKPSQRSCYRLRAVRLDTLRARHLYVGTWTGLIAAAAKPRVWSLIADPSDRPQKVDRAEARRRERALDKSSRGPIKTAAVVAPQSSWPKELDGDIREVRNGAMRPGVLHLSGVLQLVD